MPITIINTKNNSKWTFWIEDWTFLRVVFLGKSLKILNLRSKTKFNLLSLIGLNKTTEWIGLL